MPKPEAMQTSVEQYFRGVATGDRAALVEIFAPDMRWRVPKGAIAAFAGLHEGSDEIADKMMGAVGDTFAAGTQKSEVRSALFRERSAEGAALAVLEIHMTARTPDGREYDNDYVFCFEFNEDGRIQELREYVDTRYAAEFFGSAAAGDA